MPGALPSRVQPVGSGLFLGLALVRRGARAEEAIRLLRARCSAWALHDELFVAYLRRVW